MKYRGEKEQVKAVGSPDHGALLIPGRGEGKGKRRRREEPQIPMQPGRGGLRKTLSI